ncbi:MAG: DUF1501 domain-containing protein [Oligoflexales bacterium]|nr:DUF1501 domain-containing protein [Oligoflexales bacterium]
MKRRDFIKKSGVTAGSSLAVSPLAMILNLVLQSEKSKIFAQTNGLKPRNYVFFQMPSAPPRWVFDLPLAPHGDKEKMKLNTSVATRLVGTTAYTEMEYATTSVKGKDMPWLWQFAVPKVGGGTRPMSELMDYMLILRGMNIGNPTHNGAQQLQYCPLGIPFSLGGLVADHSDRFIPALNHSTGHFSFISRNGLSSVTLTQRDNVYAELLKPFLKDTAAEVVSLNSQRELVKQAFSNLQTALDQQAKSLKDNYAQITQAQKSAISLIQKNFGDLTARYNQTFQKYQTLVDAALNNSYVMPGINDKPIGAPVANRSFDYEVPGGRKLISPDLRGQVTAVRGLAQRMAIAEFVLVEGLSSVVQLGLDASDLKDTGYVLGDEHEVGRWPSFLANTYQARASAACLLELIDRLKQANVFNDTVIQMSGEFGRNPRGQAGAERDSGSDHADDVGNVALYSGSFIGNEIVGNIAVESRDLPLRYPGTWGSYSNSNITKAGIELGPLHLGHFAATMASVLRIPNPVTVGSSLVSEKDGKIESILPPGKIV